ncbi:MAG: DNA internalization-related competence protein ComEC/Rec2 [Bacilli bacterium]
MSLQLLKILSNYKIFAILLLIWLFTSLVVFPRHSLYKGDETSFTGTIKEVSINDKQLTFKLKVSAKETLQGTYFFKTSTNINIEVGDKVKVIGKLTPIPNPTIPGIYSYKNYYASFKIYNYLETAEINIIKKGSFSLKKLISKQISKSPKSAPYLETFYLGITNNIARTTLDSYRTNGISHLFSVSGMHISLLIIFLKKKPSVVLLILCGFLYLFNNSVSFLRAFLSFFLGYLNNKYHLSINSKILAVLSIGLLLLLNPYYIYQIGFWYSSVISLILIFNSDLFNKQSNYFKKIGFISFIAFLSSIPISLNFFFTLNFLTPLFNLLFVPFYTFLIVPLSLLCFVFPFIDSLFFMIIKIFEAISNSFSKVLFGTFILGKPSLIVLLLIIIGLVIALYGFRHRQIVFLLPFLLIIIILIIKPTSLKNEVYILDVGQGDSILVKSQAKTMLIDTSKNKGKDIVLFLKSLKITTLDYLVITHGDLDHIGGSKEILNSIRVKEIIYNLGSLTKEEEILIAKGKQLGTKLSQCTTNRQIILGDIKLTSLNKEFPSENDSSCILYADGSNYKFLFTGDSGILAEQELLRTYQIPQITFLKVGHHGSNTSTSNELLKVLSPKYGFISVGLKNSYHHPSKKVLSNLKKHNIIVKSTSLEGTIRVLLERKGTIYTYPPYNRVGRYKKRFI